MVDWKRNAISWFDFNGMKAAQGIYLLSHPPNWLKVPINSNQWNSEKTLGGFEDRTQELLLQEFIWQCEQILVEFLFIVSSVFWSEMSRNCYRVSHIEMNKVNWLWKMERLRFSISYLRRPIQEVMTFGFYEPIFKKILKASRNSLRQEKY